MRYLIIILLCLSSLLSHSENRRSSIDSLQACLRLAKNDSVRATLMREIGLGYVNSGNYPKAIEMFLKAKDLFQSIGNEYGIFRCDNILAVTYCYTGDYEISLNLLMKAKRGLEDGLIYDNLGLLYYHKNDIIQSLANYKKALAYYQLKGDKKLIANKLNDVGSLQEILGQLDTAISYYNESLKMSDDKLNVSGIYASLGDIYFKKGNSNLALKYELMSLAIAREIGDLISIRETEKILSDIYLSLGDCKTSLIHYKNYITIKDSLVNEDNIKRIVRIEESSKFEKEKEITKLEQAKKDVLKQEELRYQRSQRNIFIIGFIIVLCLSTFLFLAFKRNQKAKIIITEQKKLVEEKKKEMVDNINYAQRIQKAILPSDEYFKTYFPQNFIIYKPKDIVSGDFYWAFHDLNGDKYFATADCTGHGVSGAMMSMIGVQLLNEIVIEKNIRRPDLILNALRNEIIKSLNQQGAVEERKDGMDISFCKLIPSRNSLGYKLECASANNPIYIVSNGEVKEIKADRMPVGKYIGNDKLFTLNQIDLELGNTLYTLSDGFCDQFGGEKGKKLMSKRFREWILELSSFTMNDIKDKLEKRFTDWIGNGEQIDDVTIMAIKI